MFGRLPGDDLGLRFMSERPAGETLDAVTVIRGKGPPTDQFGSFKVVRADSRTIDCQQGQHRPSHISNIAADLIAVLKPLLAGGIPPT